MAKGGRVQLCSNCKKKKGERVIVEKSRRGISRWKGDEEDEEDEEYITEEEEELESESYYEFIASSSDSEDDGCGEFGGNLEEFSGTDRFFEDESDFEFDYSEFGEEEEIRAKSSKKGRKKSGKKQTKARRKVSDSDKKKASPVKRTRKNTKSKVSRPKKPTVPKNKKEKKSGEKRGRGRKTNSPKEPATKRRRRSGQIKLHINQTEILKPDIEPIKCYQAPSKGRNLKAKIDQPVTILAFDIETTGFNTPAERIVEIAARNLIGGRYSTFQTLIDPQKRIRNSDIHGITNSMIKKDGAPRIEDVIPRLFEWVEQQEPDKPVIWLAHNGKAFDFPFLIREMNRCGFDVPDRWRFFDTLTLARRLVDSNGLVLKKHKVTDLCEFFGIVVEEAAHRAMGDVNRLSYIFQHTTIRLEFTVSDLIKESLMASDIKWKPMVPTVEVPEATKHSTRLRGGQVPQVVNRRGCGGRGGRRGRGARQPPPSTEPDRVYTGSFYGGYTGFDPYAWSMDQFQWWR
ncbi:uncharacterized protein LOC144546147 [Carex rostrata]